MLQLQPVLENIFRIINLQANFTDESVNPSRKLDPFYISSEVLVGILTCIGNFLVIYAFIKNRSIRKYCNFYIVSLAIADLLIGLVGVPFAILISIGYPENHYGCLFTISTLMGLCYVSIVCLVGVSFDRFWAITYPFGYYKRMTTRNTIGLILLCWIIGATLGFLPLFGWYNHDGWKRTRTCYVTEVVSYKYLAFICFTAIILPSFILSFMYAYIHRIVKAKISESNQIPNSTTNFGVNQSAFRQDSKDSTNRETLIFCILKQGEAKAAMKLGILVIAFVGCWLPLYTINTIQAFCPTCQVPESLLKFTIVLSHANSCLNPCLYAYHLTDFRITMGQIVKNLFSSWKVQSNRSTDAPKVYKVNQGIVQHLEEPPSQTQHYTVKSPSMHEIDWIGIGTETESIIHEIDNGNEDRKSASLTSTVCNSIEEVNESYYCSSL